MRNASTHNRWPTIGFTALALTLALCLLPSGCNQANLLTPNNPPADPGTSGTTSGGGGASNSPGSQSVGDVTIGGSGGAAGQALPDSGGVQARVRNESQARADVTLRFIADDTIVHLAFVRVLPNTATSVASPKPATIIEASGTDESGRALNLESFVFGVDFDAATPAEYTIRAQGDSAVPDPTPVNSGETSITTTEPSTDQTVAVGSTFRVRWEDTSSVAGAVVRVLLRPTGSTDEASLIPVGPAVGAALDGINDELMVVLQGVNPGTYDVMAQIDDGTAVVSSVAPGSIEAVEDPNNIAPTLSIDAPSSLTLLSNGEVLNVAWQDSDPDDNATILFTLEPTDAANAAAGTFTISPPLAESPDGPGQDAAPLLIVGVLPGLYDLVGTIDDGKLIGTARVSGAVRVQPDPTNDPPTLTLSAPAEELTVAVGASFLVAWDDSDANDNARISILLDPDYTGVVELDGNEFLLAASLGEDADGPGDQITLGIPEGIPAGGYRVVGLITDGATQTTTQAPALVFVTDANEAGGGGTEQARQVSLLQPSEALASRLGAAIPFEFQMTGMPADAEIRLLLTSDPGDSAPLRVDVTPNNMAEFLSSGLGEFRLPDSTGEIPNDWWPRRFALTIEVVADGIRYTSEAPAAIWIRQEVEVFSVKMINYSCTLDQPSSTNGEPFFGLEVQWYGGGFTTNVRELPHALQLAGVPRIVQFWLSGDGPLLGDQVDDANHRNFFQAAESPNQIQVSRIDYATLLGFDVEINTTDPPRDVKPQLDSGSYELFTFTESDLFGPIIAGPMDQHVEVCFPLPALPTGP